jgi:DNA-binding transcriptional MocR family regulator
MPLSAYYFGRARAQNALVLGFGGVRADSVDDGMKRLAAAIDDARRRP